MSEEEWDTPQFITARAARAFLSALATTIVEAGRVSDFDFALRLENALADFEDREETGPFAVTAQDKGDLLFLRQRLAKNIEDDYELSSIARQLNC